MPAQGLANGLESCFLVEAVFCQVCCVEHRSRLRVTNAERMQLGPFSHFMYKLEQCFSAGLSHSLGTFVVSGDSFSCHNRGEEMQLASSG